MPCGPSQRRDTGWKHDQLLNRLGATALGLLPSLGLSFEGCFSCIACTPPPRILYISLLDPPWRQEGGYK